MQTSGTAETLPAQIGPYRNRVIGLRVMPVGELRDNPRNWRKHPPAQEAGLDAIMRQVGVIDVVRYNEPTGRLWDGHLRKKLFGANPATPVVVLVTDLSEEEEAIALATFDPLAGMALADTEALQALLRAVQDVPPIQEDETLRKLLHEVAVGARVEKTPSPEEARRTLAQRFIVPPFSVLDARQGYWQARKAAWIALGIHSEVGRPQFYDGSAWKTQTGRRDEVAAVWSVTSIFDPVLCECAYRWFCPPGGVVLDPFAGGSVRGIVAAMLGRRYVGIELRPEQVAANEQQAAEIVPEAAPRWIVGDSRHLSELWPDEACDFVFTCPPYFDLEKYSDDPADLSNAGDYQRFLADYRAIIAACLARLRPDRFAAVVVADIRDRRGMYRNFVSDTIAVFQDAGVALYNEAVLVTEVGTLPVRVGRQFEASRKLGKAHQNVLVFVKGDPRRATEAVGPVECGDAIDAPWQAMLGQRRN